MDFPLQLLILPKLILLPPITIVEIDAQKERHQHGGHHGDDIIGDNPPLPLNGLQRHVARQKDRPVVDRPHVVEGLYAPDVVVEKDVLPVFQALLHLRVDIRVLDAVRPVEIGQVEVARAPHPHALGLEDEPLALRVHNIQRRLLVVEALRKGLVNGVVDILGIEGSDLLPVAHNRALDRIGPGAHMVDIGLGNRQPHDCAAGRKVQILRSKLLAGIGDAGRLSRQDQRYLGHGLVFLIGLDVGLRVLRLGNLLGDQRLELYLAAQYRLNGTFDQIQTLAQALDRGVRHLLGYLPRYRVDKCAQDAKDQYNGEEQALSIVLLVRLLVHWQSPFRCSERAAPYSSYGGSSPLLPGEGPV